MSQPTKSLKVFIHAMDGTGHLNACVGLSQALTKRGHKVVFLVNDAFKGQFSKFGFEERTLTSAPKPNKGGPGGKGGDGKPAEPPAKMFARMIIKMGLLGPKTPLERLKEEATPGHQEFFKTLYDSIAEYNPQFKKAIEEEKPDLFILDHFLLPPAIPQSGVPWLYLSSGNPLSVLNSPLLPPFSSGYSVNSDRALWDEFRTLSEAKKEFGSDKYQNQLNKHFGYEPQPDEIAPKGTMFPYSKYGCIYGYPEELDYQNVIPIPDSFIRLDAFCRETPEPFTVPEELGWKPGQNKLIYFSLGSMGSADTELVQRVSKILSTTGHKIIVSKGPLDDEYDLPANCWGEGYLPQTRILPLVDLVITHGGNNTITETFSFGRPMIVMPLFGDQYDNAQRVQDQGYGIRIDPYTFEDQTLVDAVEKLLADTQVKQRLQTAVKRIETTNSKERACEKIEKLVEKYATNK